MPPELEDIVQDIEEVDDSRLIVDQPAKRKKASRPKKPTPKQEFIQPLPPDIPTQIQRSRFKFDTTPFRETLQAGTPEELGRQRALREATRRGVPSLRSATPEEARELRSIQEEQDLYDKFGPLYTIFREGGSRLGTSLAEPFQATYGDTLRTAKGLAEGKSLEEIKAENRRGEQARQAGIARYVTKRGGYDPLKLERAIPQAVDIVGQALIGPKGGKGGVEVTPPRTLEIGGVPPRVPPRLGEGRVFEGGPPPEPTAPIAPLELRQGRTIVGFPPVVQRPKPAYLPPSPDRLARLDPGPMRPMWDVALAPSTPKPTVNADDMSFDLLPALRPGQAPVMITPSWVLEAATGMTTAGGVNIRLKNVPSFKNSLIVTAPSKEALSRALFEVEELVKASQEEGLDSISLKSRVGGTDIVPHETFHAGQIEVTKLGTGGVAKSVFEVHDPDWARTEPAIQDIIERNPGIKTWIATPGSKVPVEDILATELPTYVAAGQGDYYFENPTAEVDFSYRYYKHLSEKYGSDALTTLETTARLPPESVEILRSARSTYESYQRELATAATQPGTAYTGGGQQIGPVRGVPGVAEGGIAGRGDQEEIGRVDEEVERALSTIPPPGRDPVEWYHSQLEKVVTDKFPNRMTVEQATAMLTPYGSKYGVKMEEYERSGLDRLLAQKAVSGEQVTRDELLEVIRDNKIKLDEKVYGVVDQNRVDELSARIEEEAELFQSFQRDAEILNERLMEVTPINFYEGDPTTIEYDQILREYEEASELANRARGRMVVLNHELRKAKGTPAPHISYKSLKGGIPGTDREVVLTIPPEGGPAKNPRLNKFIEGRENIYQSSHYSGVENPVVHFRMDEGYDADGKRVLRVQEIQSDWHQAGREKGYKPNDPLEQVPFGAVPDAPFKQTWPDLAFKRILRWAADNGFERIVWPTGAQQIDLYEDTLRQNVKAIRWESDLDGIHLYPVKHNDPIGDAGARYDELQKLTPQRLKEIVGPKIADQILSQIDNNMGSGVIEGSDLSIGGQLHKFLYDQRLVQIARDYAKKFGGDYKIGKVVTGWPAGVESSPDGGYDVIDPEGNVIANFHSRVVAEARARKLTDQASSKDVHSFTLSPKLQEKAKYEGFALSTPPPEGINKAGGDYLTPTIGDKVRVRGYSNNAEVTKVFDDGVEVRFPDGTTDEFDLTQVTKLTPKATPKVQESSEKLKILQKESIVTDLSDPRQLSLPGIEAPIKKVAEPPLPPVDQPPLPGFGPERPSLFKERVRSEYVHPMTEGFKQLLEAGGFKYDPTMRPFLQVNKALLEGKINPKGFADLLDQHGLSIESFAKELEETVSEAARVLQHYSQLSREDLQIVKMMKEDLELAKKVIPAKQRMEAILRDIESTQLGKSFLQRGGDLATQLMLSDIRIAIRNAITTTLRIPIIAGENMIGAWLKAVTEGKYKGKTLEQMIEAARSDAMTGLEVASEMISALKPSSLTQLMVAGSSANRLKYDEAITQLQKSFPDLHRELVTPGFGPEEIQRGKESVDIARDTLMDMRIDVKNRDEYVKRLSLAEERLQSNVKGLGRALNAVGYPMDRILKPMNWAEMFFRGPIFYGHLNMRMRLEGKNLAEMIAQGKFDEIPEDILKDAIDEALFATHAYMPRKERGQVESAAKDLIKGLNKVRLGAPLTGQWFPRALYSSLKFAYEYIPMTPLIGGVPFGMIKPAMRVLSNKTVVDSKTGKNVRIDPPTFRDYKRLAGGLIGTILYVMAEWFLDSEHAGPEWYQMKTGKTGKNGEPVYVDLRGYLPLAAFLKMADLNRRMRKGLLGDMEYGKELRETIAGMSQNPEAEEWANSMARMWNGDGEGLWEKSQVAMGRQMSFTTRPFVNLRDAYAAFRDEENKRKDLKGSGILGPLIDNVPWVRQYLPNVESMTQESPRLSEYPATTFGGLRFAEGENFAGREWRRLGLFNKTFMNPDVDQIVNRAQNRYFRMAVSQLGRELEKDPFYAQSNDEMKAALWEMFIGGDDGIASQAQELGLMENPAEALKRGLIQGSEMGPKQRKAFGIDKAIKESIPKK